MNKKTIVIGHLNPDTDTVCSAIVYAWYLNKKGIDCAAYVAGDVNKETSFVLDKFGFKQPEILKQIEADRNVHIVDTNNKDELISGIENADIDSIVDHHLLYGNISSNKPINIIIKPYGCTATILYEQITKEGIALDKDIASLMLSCILSDTLNLTSPTTTQVDKTAVEDLENLTGESANDLSASMFEAKSDLAGFSAKDLILMDSKVSDFAGKTYRVSVLETTKPKNSIDMQDELEKEIENLNKQENNEATFLFVIDIIKMNATLLAGDSAVKETALKIWGNKAVLKEGGKVIEIEGVVSRKKQIIPMLKEFFG